MTVERMLLAFNRGQWCGSTSCGARWPQTAGMIWWGRSTVKGWETPSPKETQGNPHTSCPGAWKCQPQPHPKQQMASGKQKYSCPICSKAYLKIICDHFAHHFHTQKSVCKRDCNLSRAFSKKKKNNKNKPLTEFILTHSNEGEEVSLSGISVRKFGEVL